MKEFYENPVERLTLGEHAFYHRGDCEFEIVRQPAGSFMPWSLHSMIEGSSIGVRRKMPCRWSADDETVTAEIACERIIAVFSNYGWPCLDLEMDFGRIAPGQSASQQGLIGIMAGTLGEFVDCVRDLLRGSGQEAHAPAGQ